MSDERGVLESREPWELPEYEVDRLLATADDPRLRRMFGADYEELRELAREALPATRRRVRQTVVFLPGILGSSLGKPRALFGNDTIWFDPVSIAMGDAPELKLTESSPVKSLGIVPLKHNFIRFRLTIAGFRVLSFHYDWRRSIPELGKRLAEFIAADRADEVMIVAHSMGGLVSRAALKAASPKVRKKIKRLVMLGTPNHGSFSPVQVLQGLNSTVQLIGKISRTDPVDLVKSTFSTFPSVYEMLPQPEVFDDFDLFDRQSWPASPYRPTAARLKAAQEARAGLADPDERFRLIAGFGQPTVTHLKHTESGDFKYFKSDSGDGTVPLQMCELDEVPTRYAISEHVDLLKHKEIANAVIELLNTGETKLLRDRPEVSRKHGAWIEPEVFRTAAESRRAWTADAMQAPLASAALAFSSVPLESLERLTAPQAEPKSLEQAAFLDDVQLTETFVNRDRQSQIDLELYCGSLFDVPYRAVVLGIFEDVDPEGPADVLDKLSGGAVRELIERRMFDGGAGHVFVAPTGRNSLRCDYIVFMGLGRYADFIEGTDAVIRLATSNTLRTLLHCGVDELATLVVGGGSGQSIRNAVRSMVCGFLEAIQEMKGTTQATVFRRLGLCEFDAKRYAELKSEVVRFAFTQDATELRFRLHEADYPKTESPYKDRKADQEDLDKADSDKAAKTDKVDINYLTVRMDGEPGDTGLWQLYASLLTSGKGAAVYPSVRTVDPATLDQLTQELASAKLADVPALSERLNQLLFSAGFRELLENTDMESTPTHMAVVHNALASRVPWEALRFGQKEFPCLKGGVSRRHEADGADSVAKHLRQRQIERTLNILLVVNPTLDLPGAGREGDALQRIIGSVPQATLTTLTGKDATRKALLDRLGSGEYDVLHYAGHAFFDPLNRRRSGLICHDETLVSADIEQLERLPALVFFNACESGRVRKQGQDATAAERRQQNVGIAEALLAGGVTQFVGTYWPVGDDPAFAFASKFYQALTSGRPVYEAVLEGRTAVHESGSTDFANYLHYGSPRFRVKHSS